MRQSHISKRCILIVLYCKLQIEGDNKVGLNFKVETKTEKLQCIKY